MKKFIFLFSFVSLISLSGMAQTKSVSVDKYRFTYGYRTLPTSPLDPVKFEYAVRIEATPTVRNNVSLEELFNAVNIRGQAKVEGPDAPVLVELTLGNIIIESSNVVEQKEEKKDKSGKVTTTIRYYMKVTYTFESFYRVTKDDKVLMRTADYSRNNKLTYTSSNYNTRKDANDYWNNNRDVLVADFYRSLSLKSAGNVSNRASAAYGFNAHTNVRDYVRIMNEKKHDENATFRAKTEELKELLQTMTPSTPMNKVHAEALIDYYIGLRSKYADSKSKADERIRYAAYYNLYKIYYYLDDTDNAVVYADLLTANGYNKKEGPKLKKSATDLQATFDKAGIHTRHFSTEGSGLDDVIDSGGEHGDDDDD